MKKCIRCNNLKPLASFVKRKSSKDGRKGTCKVCHNDRSRKLRAGLLDTELKEYRELNHKRDELSSTLGLCNTCGEEFTVTSNGRAVCSKCVNTYKRDSYSKKCKERKKAYYLNNKEGILLKRAERYEANPAYQLTYQKEYGLKWDNSNRGQRRAITRKYQASKLKATPKWLTKEMFLEMEEYYISATVISAEMGVTMHVDHIIPLQGKTVCGLHVPWNLQVITAAENYTKANKT